MKNDVFISCRLITERSLFETRWDLYSSEVLRVVLGVYLPIRALVMHRVLQAVPVFVIGGVKARVFVPRAPVLVQVLESG